MSAKLALPKPQREPDWMPGFLQAVHFLSGNYGAERVREAQKDASSRGSRLKAEEVSRIFLEAAAYMALKIGRTTNMGPWVDCPGCSKGYVYVGPGMTADSWGQCTQCDGTGTVARAEGK